MKRWGWSCPDDDVLAAYVDGALKDAAKRKAESHLANCVECRNLIGDVVTMRRSQPRSLPFGLEQRAIAIKSPKRHAGRRVLIPLTVASVVALALGVVLLRTPKKEIGTASPSTVPPVIAKSEAPSLLAPSNSNVVRKSTPSEPVPALILPREDAVIKPSELSMEWKIVPRTRYYEIHLVDSDGDPVWQGESQTAHASVPVTVALKDGAYFAWIAAYTEEGRIQESSPVRFVVNSSR